MSSCSDESFVLTCHRQTKDYVVTNPCFVHVEEERPAAQSVEHLLSKQE